MLTGSPASRLRHPSLRGVPRRARGSYAPPPNEIVEEQRKAATGGGERRSVSDDYEPRRLREPAAHGFGGDTFKSLRMDTSLKATQNREKPRHSGARWPERTTARPTTLPEVI